MGIVNVTPDSFSDGGKHDTTDAAINHAMRLAGEKADILDIGGESTRPGAAEVTTAQELERILPVIKQLATMTKITISIDTYKATVANAALGAGATIVNDVWGLQREPEIASVAADHNATVVINHWEKNSDPAIEIIDRLKKFYERSIMIAHKAGIADDRIVLDPGIGFGKTVIENLKILDRQAEIIELGYPLLIGTSRKSFLGILLEKEPDERLFGTIATNVLATQRGAAIFRVHDVAAHKDAIRVTHAILSQAVDAGSG
ncbi:MAG: dihydropteroate synthase [Cohaesibacteraceae bacterium]|nr:dihydropteroate synthase [Cohaesibacteraceae bacterium]